MRIRQVAIDIAWYPLTLDDDQVHRNDLDVAWGFAKRLAPGTR